MPQLPSDNNFITVRPAKLLHDIAAKKTVEVVEKKALVRVYAVADNYYRVATAESKKGFMLKTDLKQL